MTDKPFLAPGCFGIGSIFLADAAECRSCPFAAECAPVAKADLERIRAKFAVKKAIKPKPITKAPSPTGAVLVVPKKVGQWMQKIEGWGVRIRESLAAGRNPFGKGHPTFMLVTCHVLLKSPGGVTRPALEHAMRVACKWQEGTAAAHALQMVQILKAYGVADDANGVLKLRKLK